MDGWFVTQEQIELETEVLRLREENERLREILENWLGESKSYEALLIKEAKRTKGGRPPEADRKEKSDDRAAQRKAKQQREDPHLAQLREWARVASEVLTKSKMAR